MIEILNLVKRFGPTITAVDGISFHVGKGEVLGFLGPNGAGKSTTMKMITGFLAPSAGSVRILGCDIRDDPIGTKEKIGYLPEGAPAYPDMTPREFLRFVADIRQIPHARQTELIALAVQRTELAGVMEQPIDTLSKGFKRRVGLA
ncbi:MAG TPA: ABC transporter ATP-binding protein, partial [Alphaproteobacteria bacterium]|nr:ABC transporter ATP-binding protein [Alphaproteobacteria bacterium]HCO90766.1 ABC transporter ATP-binding protein [Alphaproteobacteria bacterium]